jgi:hypothetical protein
LAEVLAWKAGRDDIAFGQSGHGTDVVRQFDSRKSSGKDTTRGGIGVAEKRGVMASATKTFLESSDASEQPDDRQERSL